MGKVRHWFKTGMRILEIGGGNGFQAQILSSWGCEVSSIDVANIYDETQHYYPVRKYDGVNIPYGDCSFDRVYSSNVLEHVVHLPLLLKEMSRVLKPSGLGIHILPTPAWRFWTSLTHYPFVVRLALGRMGVTRNADTLPSLTEYVGKRGSFTLFKRVLFDGPHGEYPNALYELYAFCKSRWVRVFKESEFEVFQCYENDLFYTGYGIIPQLSLNYRQRMARFLGSAARIYVMHKRERLCP